jgi:hypothetical protein
VHPGCYEETVLHLELLPAIDTNNVIIFADNGFNSGAILVEIIGGTFPFQYLWNSGQTTESLFNIMHGQYSLTVTDRLGCDEVFTFVVPFISGTNEIGAEATAVKIWPTVTTSGDKIQLVNTGTSNLNLSGINWWSMQGQNFKSPANRALAAGETYIVDVPELMAPGVYFFQVYFVDGSSSWTKIIISD